MIISTFFSKAHAIARQTRQHFATYRGAFSVALRGLYAEYRSEKLQAENKKAARNFQETPIQDPKLVGYTKLIGCEQVRAVFANERVFYIEGDVYDFECDALDKLDQTMAELTVGFLGAPRSASKPKAEEVKAKPIVKKVETPIAKRPASGGFLNRRKVGRVLGLQAIAKQETDRLGGLVH